MSDANAEQLFVTTTPGLEEVLAEEARALGRVSRMEEGVRLEGPRGLHRAANLHLRCASRVLLRVANLEVRDARALESALKGVCLAAFRGPQGLALGSVEVRGAPYGRREVEAAASRALRLVRPDPRAGASVGNDPGRGADPFAPAPVGVWLRAVGGQLTVSVDTSGALLFRRGYRQEVSRAPLRETLAAGILALAGHRSDETLVDPMCGSGTFLIEGAWRAMGRAPGSLRPFAFEAFPSHDPAAWSAQKQRAVQAEGTAPKVYGRDLNAGALGTARRNARRAGVQPALVLERTDLSQQGPPAGPPGLVVVNPPYGKRVGERAELEGLYQTLGSVLRERFRGWRAAVLVPDARLSRALALPDVASHPLENGGLRIQLEITQLT